MELKHDERMAKPEEWLIGSANIEMSQKRVLKIQTSSEGEPELRIAVPNHKIWKVEISVRILESDADSIEKPAGSDTNE